MTLFNLFPQAWLYKHNQSKRKTVNFSSTWKKKYFVLKRFREAVHLFYYDNKPKTSREEPKGMTDYLLNDFIQVMVRTVHKTQ